MDSKIIDGKRYNYVWGDEFDSDTIDHGTVIGAPIEKGKKWNTNGMMIYYPDFSTPADVEDRKKYNYIKDGELVMKAGCFDWSKYEKGSKTYTNTIVDEKLRFATGGVLTTCQTMVFRKGYAEIRAKLPFNNGAWPAWWTRSTGSPLIKYPEFGGTDDKDPVYTLEIDIFETWSFMGTKIYPNLHKWYRNRFTSDGIPDYRGGGYVHDYDGCDVTEKIVGEKNYEYDYKGRTFQFSCNKGSFLLPEAKCYDLPNPEEYHTYGFLWTDEKMVFSVDGNDYYTIDLTQESDGYHDGKYGYNQYNYFLFDCDFMTDMAPLGGPPEQRYSGSGDTSDIEFKIQYIRLYQEQGKEDIIINE